MTFFENIWSYSPSKQLLRNLKKFSGGSECGKGAHCTRKLCSIFKDYIWAVFACKYRLHNI